jgi:hypothetical protein
LFLIIIALARPSIAEAEDFEQRFLLALTLINQGRAQEGVGVLRILYAEAPTPRIRLELARALMFTGESKEAKHLFVQAYNENPSSIVKANILNFIGKIDRDSGKLTLSLSAARYSNPLQQPGAYNFNFGGISLSYEPDLAYRNLWGVTAGAQFLKDFTNGLTVSGSTTYRALSKSAANRFTADVYLSEKLSNLPLQLQIGTVRLSQRFQSFTLPYVQATYNYSLSARAAFQPSLRVGYYSADAGLGVSGWQADSFTPYVYTPTPTKVFAIGPSVLRHSVGFGEQSFTSVGFRMIATTHSNKINIESEIQGRVTSFDRVDPFWKQRRKETGLYASVSVSSEKIRVGSFLPGIVLSCDTTRATIQYYRQGTCDTQVILRKLF